MNDPRQPTISPQEQSLRDNAAIALWTASTFLAIAVGAHSSVFAGLIVAAAAYGAVWWFLQR